MKLDNIGGMTQGDLRRFIVNLLASDPGALPKTAAPVTSSGTTLPVGAIILSGLADDTATWLICDGRAVSRTTYNTLFLAIGTAYGIGDGSTTFNLPDLRDKVPVGKSGTKALGATGGESAHTLTIPEMPSHNHDWGPSSAAWMDGGTFNQNFYQTGASVVRSSAGTGSTGGGGSHNNMQPYQVVNFMILATST